MAGTKDPTIPMRKKARSYPDVDEGTACTQSSFKIGKRAFLYIGTQGGRYKAMFKLKKSMPQALKLAKKEPDCYAVGTAGWVTARFTADQPMPTKRWEAWLDESHQLSLAAGGKKPAKAKVAGKKSAMS
jgi:hypothetical protein